MPDIPVTDINRLPSELATGLFSDRMLATRLDTQERLDDMFGNFNVPPITYIPKDLRTDQAGTIVCLHFMQPLTTISRIIHVT